jgi:hypothetical protein
MRQEHHQEKKVRLSVDCTSQERMYIKMLATKRQMTISEYLLYFARKEMPKCGGHHCKRSHEPNKETAKVLRDIDEGKNLIEHETLDEFWDALGFNRDA